MVDFPFLQIRKKTLLEKVDNSASHLKDEIVSEKDHLVEFAGEGLFEIAIKSKTGRLPDFKNHVRRI